MGQIEELRNLEARKINFQMRQSGVFVEWKTLMEMNTRVISIENMKKCIKRRRMGLQNVDLSGNKISPKSWSNFF